MRKNAAFTLMELLVAVGLMVVLMTAIVLIFYRSTDVMKINGARIDIFENARAAMDTMSNDIQNSVPVAGTQQRMSVKDYQRPAAGPVPVGSDADGATDYLGLVTTATAPSGSGATASRELMTVFVEYFLTADEDAESSFTSTGYTSAQRSQRRIFVLKRRMWAIPTLITSLDTQLRSTTPLFAPYPGPLTITSSFGIPGPVPGLMILLEEADLCHWIVSFNIEVYSYDAIGGPTSPKSRYYELDDPSCPYTPGLMPLGGLPGQATPPTEPPIPRKFRLSLRVIEGAGERQERLIQREIWSPTGG